MSGRRTPFDAVGVGLRPRCGSDDGSCGSSGAVGARRRRYRFRDELHGYGIYGPKDYNARLAKITCDRLGSGRDARAEKSAEFLSHNLPRGTSTAQTWQFLAAAINTYCDDLMPMLASVAEPNH